MNQETGLYYYRARYYDANTGRFISKDPIGFSAGDVNLYRYVGNNPVNWTDPEGLIVSCYEAYKKCTKDCKDQADKCAAEHKKTCESDDAYYENSAHYTVRCGLSGACSDCFIKLLKCPFSLLRSKTK
ncbi:MAG: RHS repeat-associated core domain-containing protein [Dissulfurispiraceae bacterium]|jgi:RHS repeat-associated protein|nr:RHS repeat-associated core domain-containing protein [Dissulfurispiraceae bacterium]